MIPTMEKLYDHANRFRGRARLGGIEGELRIYGGGRIAISYDEGDRRHNMLPIPDGALMPDASPRLELHWRGEWMSVEDYPAEEVAARVERFGSLQSYKILTANYGRLVEDLKHTVSEMAPEDAEHFKLPEFPILQPYTDEYRESI